MAHSRLKESLLTPTQDEHWTPIPDIYSMEHADLASLTMFIETFARKHNLIPRELLPKWVASARDVPPNYGQPAFHWESARANFEAPLGNKDGGLHLSLTAQTVQHTEGDQEDYRRP